MDQFRCCLALLAMLLVARALGPVAGTRALLLAPLVPAALPTLSAVQKAKLVRFRQTRIDSVQLVESDALETQTSQAAV